MKYIKFILAHILIDVLFIVLMVWIYSYGHIGKILIRDTPLSLAIAIVIFISVKNVKNRKPTELLGDAFLSIGMFMFYLYAIKNNYDILASNFILIKIMRGLIILSIFFLALSFIKQYLTAYLKSAHIFYIAHREQDFTILESVVGATLRFKYTLAVPVFNKIIRNCLHEIFIKLKGYTQETEMNNSAISALYENIKDSKIIKMPKLIIKNYVDYIDECILVYSYCNPERGLFTCTVEAISIFIKNAIKLLEQMTAIILLQYIIKVALFCSSVFIIFNLDEISIKNIIAVFIFMKVISFVVQDAIVEPFMLQKILETFLSFPVDTELTPSIRDSFPVLGNIKKLCSNQNDAFEIKSETVTDNKDVRDNTQANVSQVEISEELMNVVNDTGDNSRIQQIDDVELPEVDHSIHFEDVILKDESDNNDK